jgi:putative CocE/NonD family hydrolase
VLTLLLSAIALAASVTPAGAATPAPNPKLPAPTYKSVSQEVLIPMDDGVNIAVTVALPSQDGQTPLPGKFPVVVGMTPYSRNGVCGCYPPDFWATRGMAGAVADVRGTGGSGGNLDGNFFSPREARDSAAVIEYLGTQPYSSGKVGMAGGSYVGITQYLAAEQKPPHLAAIAPQVALSDLYREGFAHGGVPSLLFDGQYVAVQGAPGAAGANNDPYLLSETLKAKLGQSPVGTTAFDYLERPNDDPFYRDRSPIYRAGDIQVPVLVIGGWRDGLSPRGAPEMYQALAKRKGVETRLYMDPCTHKGCGPPFAPLTDPPGQIDVSALVFEFLSQHLNGTQAPARPPVEYYLQKDNGVVDADTWPPPSTKYEELALDRDTLQAPTGDSAPGGEAQYVTNPAAGFGLAFNQYGTVAASPYVPTDQRLEGPEGLTFRTGALERPLDLVGPTALHLVAASTATDTDWHAKLADVAPDGSESIITEGSLRASHRSLDQQKSKPGRPYHPHTDPQPIEPGKFYDYDLEIWPTAYRLGPGHRLQLRLTSTDLPTHLPGSINFHRDHPQDARIDLQAPAINTVRFKDSHLTVPVSGANDKSSAIGSRPGCAPAPRASVSRNSLRSSRRSGIKLTGRASGFRCIRNSRHAGKIVRVELSVARKAGKRCRFLDRRGRLAASRSCARPSYLKAALGRQRAGKVPWTFRTRGTASPGLYVARVRARDADGRTSSTRGRHVVQRFRIR